MVKGSKDAMIASLLRRYAHPEQREGENEPMGYGRYTSSLRPYPALCSPLMLGRISLRNRCIILMDNNFGAQHPDERMRRFYAERASAGIALMTCPPISSKEADGPMLVQRYLTINECIHARAGKMLLQLKLDGKPEQICYLAAAAPIAGFDGFCIDARDSTAACDELVRRIKQRHEHMPVLVRLSLSPAVWECGMNQPKAGELPCVAQQLRLIEALDEAGVDAVAISLGGQDTPWLQSASAYLPAGCYANVARVVKTHVRLRNLRCLVAACGRLSYPDLNEKLLAAGDCDMIALDGSGVSDSAWAGKVINGKVERILPCPLPHYAAAEQPAHTAVIGAGCRGMAYSLQAANAGSTVDLFEQSLLPGGSLLNQNYPAFSESSNLLSFLERELEACEGVRKRFGTRADTELLKQGGYDRIVFAVSPRTRRFPNIPGWGKIPFLPVERLSSAGKDAFCRQRIVVLGSDESACAAAWHLTTEAGAKRVVLAAREGELLPGGSDADRAFLQYAIPKRSGKILARVQPVRVTDRCLILEETGGIKQYHVNCDRIILADWSPSAIRLYQEAVRDRLAPEIILI